MNGIDLATGIGVGLRPSTRPVHIYVNGQKDGPGWHALHNGVEMAPIPPALTGLVTALAIEDAPRGGDDKTELVVTVLAAGSVYHVHSGVDTMFARGLAAKLATLVGKKRMNVLGTDRDARLLTVEVRRGDKQTAIFADLVDAASGTFIRAAEAEDPESEVSLRRIQPFCGDIVRLPNP